MTKSLKEMDMKKDKKEATNMTTAMNPITLFEGSIITIIVSVLVSLTPSPYAASYSSSLSVGGIVLSWIGLAVCSANPGSFTFFLKRKYCPKRISV
jgi:hypothetical protein